MLTEMFRYSASQIKTWRSCPRKWYYEYVAGRKTPPGVGAALGTEIHAQLEEWLRNRVVPTHEAALALLPLLPHPSPDLLIEHRFELLTAVGIARGFIDVMIPLTAAKNTLPDHIPQQGHHLPLVIDHKTTAQLQFALTEEELETDPQAILYGLEARRFCNTTSDVLLNWNYTQTRGRRATKPVVVQQTQGMFETGFALLRQDAAQMGAAASCEDATDVGFNTTACGAFGGCPHRDLCTAYTARSIGLARLDNLPIRGYVDRNNTGADMGFLDELRKASSAPLPKVEDPEMEIPPSQPLPPPAPVAVSAPPPSMPPIEIAAGDQPATILPPELPPRKRPVSKKIREGETVSVEALVRQAFSAAVETDNLRAVSALAALLHELKAT